MTTSREIADFASEVAYNRLPDHVRESAKRRILDAVGVALRNRNVANVGEIRRAAKRGSGTSRIWGSTATAPAADAAMSNAAAIEAGNGPIFLSPTLSSPSGSIAAVLAIAEARDVPGEETLAGLAAAFEVHGELAWNAPLDEFHPATHGTVAAAAGVGRTMGLDVPAVEHAVGTAASRMTLAVGDDEDASLPVGLAASTAVRSCCLAECGVESPDAIASTDGWHDLVGPFDLDLDPGCERVRDAAILPYDAHPYGQPAIEAAIDLTAETPIDPADLDGIAVETFAGAVPAIDPERIAAALVDRQLFVHRGARVDLEPIVDETAVVADDGLTDRVGDGTFPTRLVVESRDGTDYESIADHFDGHPTAAASWGTVEEKFQALADDRYDIDRRDGIVKTVRAFEAETAAELARLLD